MAFTAAVMDQSLTDRGVNMYCDFDNAFRYRRKDFSSGTNGDMGRVNNHIFSLGQALFCSLEHDFMDFSVSSQGQFFSKQLAANFVRTNVLIL